MQLVQCVKNGLESFVVLVPSADSLPRLAITLYFVYLVANMAFASPENSVSTGVHQTVGPCSVTDLDLAGHARQVYLCADTHVQDWTFQCGNANMTPKEDFTEWYTVCGKTHSNWQLWMAAMGSLAALGIVTYRHAFSPSQRREKLA
jgi:hypothetical protein